MTGLKQARADLASARELVQGRQPGKALPLFRRAAAVARESGDREIEADAELGCGESLYLLDGRERESLPHLGRAAELAPGTALAAMAWMTAADALRVCGDIQASLAAHERAIELFVALQDVFGECLVRQGLGTLLVIQGRGEEALPHLERAAVLALGCDEPARAAEITMIHGELLLKLGRSAEAVPALEAGARLFQSLGDRQKEAQARAKLLVALNAVTSGRVVPYEQLIRMAELLAEEAAERGDFETEGISQAALAQLLAEQDASAGDERRE
ncbi:MAG: hypothetical protein JWN52_322 [Actinomycetia bacterium]|nr:hypothetical protein [Actinomycetes bacterium]